jgi:hypothetical protein
MSEPIVPEVAVATASPSALTAKSSPLTKKAAPVYTPPAFVKPSYPTAPMPRPRPSPPAREREESQSQEFVQKNWKALVLSIGILALVVFGIAFLFSDSSGPDTTNTPLGDGYTVSHKLTAEEYWMQFNMDNAAAGLKFDGISVQITGKVRKIISDSPKGVVLLETSSSTRGVECQFSSDDAIQKIKVGDDVVVVGEGRARRQPKTENVVVAFCRLRQ